MPDVEQIKFQPLLTNVSLDYRNRQLVADQVLPYWDIQARDPRVPEFDKDDQFRMPNDRISPRANANETEFGINLINVQVRDWALAEPVSPDEEKAAGVAGLPNLMNKVTEFVTMQLMMRWEQRVAAVVTNPSNYANTLQLTGTDKWTDPDNSDPIGDVMALYDSVFYDPNVMVVGNVYHRALRVHPAILDAIKSTPGATLRGGKATMQQLADFFEVEKYIVTKSQYNSAVKGQTAVYQQIWTHPGGTDGRFAALLHIDPNPGPRSLTFGATFTETRRFVGTYFDPRRGAKGCTMVKVSWNSHEKIVNSAMGALIYE